MHVSDKGRLAAAEYLHHFPFASLARRSSGLGHCHSHSVAVKGMPSLGGLDIHVRILIFDIYKDVAFTGHLCLADDLLYLLASTATPAVLGVLTLVIAVLPFHQT